MNVLGVILQVLSLIYMINACLRLIACVKVTWSKSARDDSALNSHLVGLELSEIQYHARNRIGLQPENCNVNCLFYKPVIWNNLNSL